MRNSRSLSSFTTDGLLSILVLSVELELGSILFGIEFVADPLSSIVVCREESIVGLTLGDVKDAV